MLHDFLDNEMFVRMLTVHCDQNDSYEWFSSQKNKRNKKRNFRSPLWDGLFAIDIHLCFLIISVKFHCF